MKSTASIGAARQPAAASLPAAPRVRDLVPLLWNRLGAGKFLFVMSAVLCLSETIIMMFVPLLMEVYFNKLDTGALGYIRGLLTLGTFIVIGLMLLGILGHYIKQNTMSSLHRDVTLELADDAQRLPLVTAQATHSADLQQRIAADSDRVSWLLSTLVNEIGSKLVMLLLAAVYLFWMQWQVALGVLLLMPLGAIGGHLLRRQLQAIGREVADQEAAVRQVQQDALQGMETLRAFGAESWMEGRFVARRTKLNRLYIRRMWWQQLVNALTMTLALLINWGSILYVAWLAVRGEMQTGAMMAIFILVWRIFNPLVSLGNSWAGVQVTLGAAIRVSALWRAAKEPAAAEAAPETAAAGTAAGLAAAAGAADGPWRGGEAIEWRDVSYRYPAQAGLQQPEAAGLAGGAPLLRGFDLALRPGVFTALVGPSGSGKSTAAKLGAGLLFPDEGAVTVHGVSPLVDADAARRLVSYVPQTPYLFAGTIRDNLRAAKPDADDAELAAAAAAAEAHDFIMALPDGYDTVMKEHGSSLSGGQKQRLALARAMLADRPVWILDEATSALDTETERRVMEAVLSRTRDRGRTLLVIAHRLTTVQDADEIIAMEDGRIAERGTHRELAGRPNGLYRRLLDASGVLLT